MNRIVHYIDQKSPDWFAVKMGKLSASGGQPSAILVNGKHPSGLGTGALTLAFKKAAERITGEDPYQFLGNDFTDAGNEWEDYIIKEYEMQNFGVSVERVGFMSISDYVGFSPDGLVGEDGLVEAKLIEQRDFLRLLYAEKNGTLLDEINRDHLNQSHFGLFVSGRKWCDLICFTPHFEFKKTMLTFRVERDEKRICEIDKGARRFVSFVQELEKLNQ